MSIKLLATDVDGTLLQEGQGTLNPEYYEVIRQLSAKGIQVVAASGRSYTSLQELFRPVEDLIWFIADGGVTTKTKGGLESIGAIPRDWAMELWQDMANIPKSDGTLCGQQTVYIPKRDSFMAGVLREGYRMHLTYQNGWEDFPEENVGKISLFLEENVEAMAAQYILPKWGSRLYTVIAGEWWLDCMMPGINKGVALEKIMKDYGIQREEILATGDNMNDIEMITLAGTGLAVSSARDELKAVADGVIGNFKTDAVLQEWKKLL